VNEQIPIIGVMVDMIDQPLFLLTRLIATANLNGSVGCSLQLAEALFVSPKFRSRAQLKNTDYRSLLDERRLSLQEYPPTRL